MVALLEEDVLRCQFHAWYPCFKHVSLPSELIPLPEDFVEYLLEDGVFLQESSEAVPRRPKSGTEWEAHTDEYQEWEEGEDDEEGPEVPSFPELEAAMRAAIGRLGGEVVPKLNWSCPKDVGWLSPSGSAKCRNPDEVMLLLKSSDTIAHDLCHSFEACATSTLQRPPQVVLGLRRSYDLSPQREFRCFVRSRQLVGISQREVTTHYPDLLEQREALRQAIGEFFEDHIRSQFAGSDYTCDVYVTKRMRVKLIDFNPWGGTTLPLLFSWEDLEAAASALQQAGEDTQGRDSHATCNGEVSSLTRAAEGTSTSLPPGQAGGKDAANVSAAGGDLGTEAGEAGSERQRRLQAREPSPPEESLRAEVREAEPGEVGLADAEPGPSCDSSSCGQQAPREQGLNAGNLEDVASGDRREEMKGAPHSSRSDGVGITEDEGGPGERDSDGGEPRQAHAASPEAGGRTRNGRGSGGHSVRSPPPYPEFRIVESREGVRPAMRAMAGVPLDLYDLTPGSAIDEFLRRANEEAEVAAPEE